MHSRVEKTPFNASSPRIEPVQPTATCFNQVTFSPSVTTPPTRSVDVCMDSGNLNGIPTQALSSSQRHPGKISHVARELNFQQSTCLTPPVSVPLPNAGVSSQVLIPVRRCGPARRDSLSLPSGIGSESCGPSKKRGGGQTQSDSTPYTSAGEERGTPRPRSLSDDVTLSIAAVRLGGEPVEIGESDCSSAIFTRARPRSMSVTSPVPPVAGNMSAGTCARTIPRDSARTRAGSVPNPYQSVTSNQFLPCSAPSPSIQALVDAVSTLLFPGNGGLDASGHQVPPIPTAAAMLLSVEIDWLVTSVLDSEACKDAASRPSSTSPSVPTLITPLNGRRSLTPSPHDSPNSVTTTPFSGVPVPSLPPPGVGTSATKLTSSSSDLAWVWDAPGVPSKAFWKSLCVRAIPKWLHEIAGESFTCYIPSCAMDMDDDGDDGSGGGSMVPDVQLSPRCQLLMAAVTHLPSSRSYVAKALAEQCLDYASRCGSESGDGVPGGGGDVSMSKDSNAPNTPSGGSSNMGDSMTNRGSHIPLPLLCLVVKFADIVSRHCRDVAPSSSSSSNVNVSASLAAWLSLQVDLLLRAVVALIRISPLASAHSRVFVEVLSVLLPLRPGSSVFVLKRLMSCWPSDSSRTLLWLQCVHVALLCLAKVTGPSPPNAKRVLSAVGLRLASCVQSAHVTVATAALSVVGQPVAAVLVLQPYALVAAEIVTALQSNSAHHWCKDVCFTSREMLATLTGRSHTSVPV